VDFGKELSLAFSDYCKGFDGSDNTSRSRTVPCIALYPCCNATGSWNFYNLVSKKRIRRRWKKMVTTDSFVKKMNALVDEEKARCELFIGAFFFAMHSCEYLSVTGHRKTKLLVVRNIHFFMGKRRVQHDDKNLHLCTLVLITFEEQKRGSKNDTITHHRTNDPLLCPVKTWARIIKRLIYVFQLDNGQTYKFTGKDLLSHLPHAADSLGPDKLRYTSDQIGLHSARSGAAMAMYLAGIPVFTIMLLGRWSSDAFLRYIRKEVQEFSNSVSSKMIISEIFFTLSDSHDSNDLLRTGSRNKLGPNFKDALQPLIRTFKAVRVT